ncbi:sensor histidine kinase [Cellulomonas massiliensis]|uniref:sensor histidine kinase n=1 Tax=Cellulomonas massiliensis TaxID=1465811 RepID=UPI00031D24C4|nr:HAMP domain-containing sensor histidine kinase [Cellulomonas massiliensis]
MPALLPRRPRGARARWTLRRRLVAVLVGLVGVVAVGMGALSAVGLHTSLVTQIDQQLEAANRRAANAPEHAFPPDGDDRRPSPGNSQLGQATGTVNAFVPAGSDEEDVRADYIDDEGALRPLDDEQVAALLALPTDGAPHAVDLGPLGDYRAVATTTAGGATAVTALPTASATRTVTTYLLTEGAIVVVALLGAGAVGLVLVRRELRPLDRIAATATRVSALPLDRGEVVLAERVPDADTDTATEVGQVGAALNQLLGHVEQALAARHESESQVRQFVADASHELRTPLASIRGYAELVRRSPDALPATTLAALGRVESESARMTVLVEDLLLLARLDAGRPLEREAVDLRLLAVDALADAHAAGPGHRWELDLPEPAEDGTDDDAFCVTGDEHRLRQVLANLLTNARVHTPAGTRVTVSLERAAGGPGEPGAVLLRVADDGPGIPESLRGRLFQRFTRGDGSRHRASGSTGLGLSIAQAVVAAHGGTITTEDGPGATFVVRLPAARTAPVTEPVPSPQPVPAH